MVSLHEVAELPDLAVRDVFPLDDPALLVAVGPGHAVVVEAATGRVERRLALDAAPVLGPTAVSGDGQRLAVMSLRPRAGWGAIDIHDLRTGQRTLRTFGRWDLEYSMVSALAFSRDARRLLVADVHVHTVEETDLVVVDLAALIASAIDGGGPPPWRSRRADASDELGEAQDLFLDAAVRANAVVLRDAPGTAWAWDEPSDRLLVEGHGAPAVYSARTGEAGAALPPAFEHSAAAFEELEGPGPGRFFVVAGGRRLVGFYGRYAGIWDLTTSTCLACLDLGSERDDGAHGRRAQEDTSEDLPAPDDSEGCNELAVSDQHLLWQRPTGDVTVFDLRALEACGRGESGREAVRPGGFTCRWKAPAGTRFQLTHDGRHVIGVKGRALTVRSVETGALSARWQAPGRITGWALTPHGRLAVATPKGLVLTQLEGYASTRATSALPR